ncbi:hypothetical protein CLOM_g20775 [Closterium sp. NIES-68]|nr:hypothetical protein CLOM_g20775 [Closterium sp. NIES-68]GJP83499.1 hypothetical protein CLOP_g13645 [Closterium sp. NIES-67]
MAAQVASRQGSIAAHQPAATRTNIEQPRHLHTASQQRHPMSHPQQQQQQQQSQMQTQTQQDQSPRYSPVRNGNYRRPALTNPFTGNPEYLPQQQQMRPQRRHRRSCSMSDFVSNIIIPDSQAQAPSPIPTSSIANNASCSSPIPYNYSPDYSPGPVSAPSALSFPPSEPVPEIKAKASTPPPVTRSQAAPPRRGRHVRRSSWSGYGPIAFDGTTELETLDLLSPARFHAAAAAADGALSGAQFANNSTAGEGFRTAVRNNRGSLELNPTVLADATRMVPVGLPAGLPAPSPSVLPRAASHGGGRRTVFPTPQSTATNVDADADSDDEFVELYGNARRHRAEAARALNALERLVSTSNGAGSPTGAARGAGKVGSPVALSPTSSPTAKPAGDDRRFSRDRNLSSDATNPPVRSPLSSRIRRTIFGQGSPCNVTQASEAAAPTPSRYTLMQYAPSMKSHTAPSRGSILPGRLPSKAPQNHQSDATNKGPISTSLRQNPALTVVAVAEGLGGLPLRPPSFSQSSVTCTSPTFAQGVSPVTGDDRIQRRRSHDDGMKSSRMRVLRRVSFSSNVEFISGSE